MQIRICLRTFNSTRSACLAAALAVAQVGQQEGSAAYPLTAAEVAAAAEGFEIIRDLPGGEVRRSNPEPWAARSILKPHSFGRFPMNDLARVEQSVRDFADAGVEVLYIVSHGRTHFTASQIAATKRAADVARDLGMTVALYTGPFGVETTAILNDYPMLEDWQQRDRNGQPVNAFGGLTFCPLSPYPMVFRLKLIEYLIDNVGFDGLFFDIPWFFNPGCYCWRCEQTFQEHVHEKFGGNEPVDLPALRDFSDPLLPVFYNWRYQVVRNVLEAIAQEIKASHPDFFFLSNYNVQFSSYEAFDIYGLYPHWINPSADAILTELSPFLIGEPAWLQGAAVSGARAEAGVPVVHAMVLDEDLVLAPPAQVLHHNAEIIAEQGMLMHRYPLTLQMLPAGSEALIEAFTRVNRFIADNRQFYNAGKSEARQAVFYSRPSALWARDASKPSFGGGGFAVRYLRHWWGSYLASLYSQNPVDVLTDHTITAERLQTYRQVVVPQAFSMSDQNMEALIDFARGGGTVIVTGMCALYDERGQSRTSFPEGWPLPTAVPSPLPPASAAPVRHEIGKGAFLHYPGPVDRAAWEASNPGALKDLAAIFRDELGPELMVSLQKNGGNWRDLAMLRVTAQREGQDLFIHLLNYASPDIDFRGANVLKDGNRFVHSLDEHVDLEVRLNLQEEIVEARFSSWDMDETASLTAQWDHGAYRLILPKLETYGVLHVKLGGERPLPPPILHYDFDEAEEGDEPAIDRGAGTPATGLFQGNATRLSTTPGNASQAALDISADKTSYVSGGNAAKLDGLLAFTLTAWINLRDDPDHRDRLLTKQAALSGGNIPGFSWAINRIDADTPPTRDRFALQLSLGGSGGLRVPTSTETTGAPESWTFLAVTYDGAKTENNVVFYHGDEHTEVSPLGDKRHASAGQMLSNNNAFMIGFTVTGATSPPAWIDDVRVYDQVLSLADVERVRLANLERIGTMGFDAWRIRHFSVDELEEPDISGPRADPWGAGVPNLLLYALDIEPGSAEKKNLPVGHFHKADEKWPGSFVSSVIVPTNRPDIEFIGEVSEDLTNWRQVELHLDPLADDPDSLKLTFTDSDASSGPDRKFLRLRARLLSQEG